MRSLVGSLLLALVVTAAMPAFADTPAAPASADPLKVGAPVTVKKPVDIAALAKKPAKFVGRTVRLEGIVKDVCQGRGCWVEVEGPKGVTFLAKSLDESVLLPKDCKGRRIAVEGVVTEMKGETEAEHAEHAQAAGHSCPRPTYLVATKGAELKAAK